jgi:uncharacterized protein
VRQPDFEQAKAYIVGRLTHELAPDLYYHGPHHTLEEVVPAAERLAAMEGIKEGDWLLLHTAALYHDCGFLEQYVHNEPIAVRIAEEALPGFGYSKRQLRTIRGIILATEVPQRPHTHLEEIMCDADLDSLGRPDFFYLSHGLRLELAAYGQPTTLREWHEDQLRFLEVHTYFTESACALREPGKRRNIAELRELLGLPKSEQPSS